MEKKFCVVLEKDDNGNYVFKEVRVLDANEETVGFLDSSNLFTISANKYVSMANNEVTEMYCTSFDENKSTIVLVLDDTLADKLKKKLYISGNRDNYEVKIKKALELIISSSKSISVDVHAGMGSIELVFPKKVLEANNATTNSSDVVGEEYNIDMSKVDPGEVIAKIKRKVIAQDRTVETVVNNIYNNQLIIETGDNDLISSKKTSIFLDGPTGTGKTLIAKQVASELSLPIEVVPITEFSAAGYKGSDIKDILLNLLKKTGGNLEAAERGIIVLDEIDKMASNKENDLEMKIAIQNELLPYLSGTKIYVEYEGQDLEFDTSKITFIGLGAFTDLRERKVKEEKLRIETVRVRMLAYGEAEEVAKEKVAVMLKENMDYNKQLEEYRIIIAQKGLRDEYEQLMKKIDEEQSDPNYRVYYTMAPEDYINEGLIREFIGRFSLLTSTNGFDRETLKKILTESEISPLKQLVKMGYTVYNKTITYSDDIIDKIVDQAFDMNTGGRALTTVVNGISNEILGELIYGDKDVVEIADKELQAVKNASVRSAVK